jgi:anti-anti-sigma regulatory factor
MPTHITQLEDNEHDRTVLRVEGQMLHDDAVLLSRIARGVADDMGCDITIDIADLDFIDSEAAAVLKALQSTRGFELTGVEILLQNAINEAERHN